MKFLIIGSVRNPSSGAKTRSRNIAKYLAKANHKVTLIELFPRNHKETTKIKGVKIIKIECDGDIIGALIVINKIKRAIRNIKADYIIARKPIPISCIPALDRTTPKIILDIDDIEWLFWKEKKSLSLLSKYLKSLSLLSKYLKYYEKQIINDHHIDYITVTCPKIKEYVIKLGFPKEKIIDLPNFLDLDLIKNIKPKISSKILIYVASLGISSDLIPILKVFKQLQKQDSTLGLIIIGDGSKYEEYEDYARKNNLNVCFMGHLEYTETLRMVSQAEICLNYAKKNRANKYRSPIKLREYLALGKKVVTNDVGDTTKFSQHIFMSTNSLLDFKEKIKKALINKTPRGGKQYIYQHYNGKKCIKEFLNQLNPKI